MKNYDLNTDGYISLEDFEKIAANFPFSFCTHDSDRYKGLFNKKAFVGVLSCSILFHSASLSQHLNKIYNRVSVRALALNKKEKKFIHLASWM